MRPTIRQRSRLLRAAVSFILLLAVLAVIGLVFEWINLTRSLQLEANHPAILRLAVLGVLNLAFTAFLATLVALYWWARIARQLPELQGWHLQMPASEFRAYAADDEYTLDDYIDQEDRVFEELEALIDES